MVAAAGVGVLAGRAKLRPVADALDPPKLNAGWVDALLCGAPNAGALVEAAPKEKAADDAPKENAGVLDGVGAADVFPV